ncbi:EamA family transporter, partial [Anaerobutyricum soehngenii]|nr:EamA family transporter [Anaerobutyricum soehngenii]
GIAFAILAAALYAINAPFSKILLEFMPPTLMAGVFFFFVGLRKLIIFFLLGIKKSFYYRW